MESILTSIKKMLGIDASYTHFDADIIMHINSVFMILSQLGVGPKEGFAINDEFAVWSDFISDSVKLNSVKTYVFLRVKLLFDPPLSNIVVESMNRAANELEFRINAEVDTA